MYDIQDMRIYLHRMQKSVLDKMFFADKVFEPIEAIVDFGIDLTEATHGKWSSSGSIDIPQGAHGFARFFSCLLCKNCCPRLPISRIPWYDRS